MGLRDFLMGAQQFQQGGQDFANTANTIRQQNAQEGLASGLPDLLAKLRTGTPEEQARLAGQFQGQYLNAGGSLKDTAEQISKFALPEQNKGKNEAYKIDEIKAIFPDKTPEEQYKLANMSRSAQDALRDQSKQQNAEAAKSKRQEGAQAFQANQKASTSAEQFGDTFNKTKKNYDDQVSGVEGQLAVFNKEPTKQTAMDLALKISKAAGNVGATSDRDVDRVTFGDLASKAQELMNTVSNTPEGPLPPEIKKAYQNLANATVEAAKSRRQDILTSQFGTGIAAHADRLLQGDKKHTIVKTIEKDLGVNVKRDENGAIVLEKSKTEHSGDTNDLISMANQIKDPAKKQQWIGFLNSKKNFTKAEIDHLSKKLKSEVQ